MNSAEPSRSVFIPTLGKILKTRGPAMLRKEKKPIKQRMCPSLGL